MKITSKIFLLLLFFIFGSQAFCQTLLPSKPPTDDEYKIIENGIRFHDNGKYDAAIAEYEKIISVNPSCMMAVYEMANSSNAKGDTANARKFAELGLKYDSPNLGRFSILLANLEDDEGHSEIALEFYKKAIKAEPDYFYGYFNLGITLLRLNRTDEALENFKKSIELNPNHLSSHLRIGKIYEDRQMRIPAIMAYTRCLLSGVDQKKSPDVFKWVKKLVNGSVTAMPGGGSHIVISMNAFDTTEGDFSPADLGSSIMGSVDIEKAIDSSRPSPSPLEKQVRMIDQILNGISICYSPTSNHGKGFAMQYYGKYFYDLVKAGHSKVICYFLAKYEDAEGAIKWLSEHQKEVEAFGAWNKEYYKK